MATQDQESQDMTNIRNAAVDESKGALIITPIPLSNVEQPECPICHEEYIAPPAPGTNKPAAPRQEWPIKVNLVAEWFGPKHCCGHIIGRHCLELHLNSPGNWRNKCPICRDVWYHTYVPEQTGVTNQQEPSAQEPSSPLRRSQRIASRSGSEQPESALHTNNAQPLSQHFRPDHFATRLRAILEVQEGSDHVPGRYEDLERKLSILYSARDSSG